MQSYKYVPTYIIVYIGVQCVADEVLTMPNENNICIHVRLSCFEWFRNFMYFSGR